MFKSYNERFKKFLFRSRLTMKILFQILIFSIFIFSQGYQSIVTSFMLHPSEEKLLSTFDQVFESDLMIVKDDRMKELYKNNPGYQKADHDGRVIEYDDLGNWTKNLVRKNLVDLQPCNLMRQRIEYEGDGTKYEGLYLISDPVYYTENDLYTRPFHPYIDKFQYLMDLSFEAGLPQAWLKFYYAKWFEGYKNVSTPEEKIFLDLGLIAPFFLILAVGFIAAFIALSFEIFYHDFVSELSKEYFQQKFRKYILRELDVEDIKIKKVQVKKIVIKPGRGRAGRGRQKKISFYIDKLLKKSSGGHS